MIDKRYALQTIKDNVVLLTKKVLGQLNIIMINHGFCLLSAADKPLFIGQLQKVLRKSQQSKKGKKKL